MRNEEQLRDMGHGTWDKGPEGIRGQDRETNGTIEACRCEKELPALADEIEHDLALFLASDFVAQGVVSESRASYGNPEVRRFEDLIVWQKARRVTSEIYRLTRDTPFSKDFGLVDQIRRSAVSVMSNIAEGRERNGPREFIHSLSIASGSCGELRSQLYVAFDASHLLPESFNELRGKVEEIARMLRGLIMALAKRSRK